MNDREKRLRELVAKLRRWAKYDVDPAGGGQSFQRGVAYGKAADEIEQILAIPETAVLSEAAALAEFTEYFVKNYPGPKTVISDPLWHAPKIFRAAKAALLAAKPARGSEPRADANCGFPGSHYNR